MKTNNHHPQPTRGGKPGPAHKRWADFRMDRPERVASLNRGHDKLMAFFGVKKVKVEQA